MPYFYVSIVGTQDHKCIKCGKVIGAPGLLCSECVEKIRLAKVKE